MIIANIESFPSEVACCRYLTLLVDLRRLFLAIAILVNSCLISSSIGMKTLLSIHFEV